jgi:uncharacterized LabA/DUF88 family protein
MTSTTIKPNIIISIITQAFIDASNLFYGGLKSLGWSIDYQKLLKYLKEKYEVEKAFYFGGVETHTYRFDYLNQESVPLLELKECLENRIFQKSDLLSQVELKLIERHLKQVKFYLKLEEFGYTLLLKPVKCYITESGQEKRKANCDVDMTYYLMKEQQNFERAIILSGDGDFLPVLKHLQREEKEIIILSRSRRTAKEIKQFARNKFRDFEYLKYLLSMEKN